MDLEMNVFGMKYKYLTKKIVFVFIMEMLFP